ncbi:MAG: flavin reductase family protein [Steroidobacteraceae bacterium]
MKRSAAVDPGGSAPPGTGERDPARLDLDPSEYRRTFGLFPSGVAVIAAEFGGTVHAMTANAVISLSLEPALVLFCASRRSKFASGLHLPPGASRLEGFSINFLREDQEALATYFAGAWRAPLAPPFRLVAGRFAPRLEGSLASVDCERHEILEGGDHWIVIGRARGIHRGIGPYRPLLFFRGQYRRVDESPGQPAPDLAAVREEPAHINYER